MRANGSNSNIEKVKRFMGGMTPEKLDRIPLSKKKAYITKFEKVIDSILKNKLDTYNVIKVHKKQIQFHKSDKRKRLLIGGNRCIAGDSMIYDPIQERYLRLDTIKDNFHVYAWDQKTNKKTIALALPPYHHKDVDALYTVTLSNGKNFTCSMNHLLLSTDGLWKPLSEYQTGCELYLPQSSLESSQSVHVSNDLHCKQIAEDSRSHYSACRRQCGEQLLSVASIDQDVFPSQVCVQGRMPSEASEPLGDSCNRLIHNRLDLYSDLLSSLDALDLNVGQTVAYVCRACGKVVKRAGLSSLIDQRPICECEGQLLPMSEEDLSVLLLDGISPVPYEFSPSSVNNVVAISSITYNRTDYKWDFTVPVYSNYILEGIVHHNTGKTVGGAVETVWFARGNHPYRKLTRATNGWVVSVTNEVQRDVAQKEVLAWLNPEWIVDYGVRDGSKSDIDNAILDYILVRSELGGISRIGFKSCEQGRKKFQGTSKDYIWFDEEPDKDIYDECLMRIMDVRGSIWLTMTPLMGLTFVYDQLYVNERNDPQVHTIRMAWEDNPFLSKEEILLMEAAMSKEELDARRDGKFVALTGLVYREYNEDVHVLQGEYDPQTRTIWLIDENGERYSKIYKRWYDKFSIDPGFTNPTSVHFYAHDDEGTQYCIAEHYESEQLPGYHAKHIKRIGRLLDWPSVNGRYTGLIDTAANQKTAASDKSVRELYSEEGINLANVEKSVWTGIQKCKKYLQLWPHPNKEAWPKGKPKFFVVQVDWQYDTIEIRKEFKKYRWALTKKDENAKESPSKFYDHAMDDWRYYSASLPPINLKLDHMQTKRLNAGFMSEEEKKDEGLSNGAVDTSQPFVPGRIVNNGIIKHNYARGH